MDSENVPPVSSSSSSNAFSRFASAIVAKVASSMDKPQSSLPVHRSPNRIHQSPIQPVQPPGNASNILPGSRSRTPSPWNQSSNVNALNNQSSSVTNQFSNFSSPRSQQQPPIPPRLEVSTAGPSQQVFLGAIPRQTSANSSFESTSEEANSGSSGGNGSSFSSRRCFCGYYSEALNSSGGRAKKPGRCKFCRSRAKYVPGQRSFDAARIFGRHRERAEPRRAVSEDRRSDGQTPEETSASTTASSSFDRPSPSSRPHSFSPFLRRQDRLDVDQPSHLLSVPAGPVCPIGPRDHGLRTPPTPPSATPLPMLPLRPRRIEDERHITHRMAHEMPEYLVPPPRTAILGRAHTDPASLYDDGTSIRHPMSPPPAYSEVMMKESHRTAPPTYEEALHARLSDLRLSGSLAPRSLSEERTTATGGGMSSNRSLRSARSGRPLTRSSRAEEIPDVYWEQAARELDFCTCRKCQTRYRQYFEEDPDQGGDAMIPMETQVLMQEVLTDGIAFCSLM